MYQDGIVHPGAILNIPNPTPTAAATPFPNATNQDPASSADLMQHTFRCCRHTLGTAMRRPPMQRVDLSWARVMMSSADNDLSRTTACRAQGTAFLVLRVFIRTTRTPLSSTARSGQIWPHRQRDSQRRPWRHVTLREYSAKPAVVVRRN